MGVTILVFTPSSEILKNSPDMDLGNWLSRGLDNVSSGVPFQPQPLCSSVITTEGAVRR